MGIPTNSYQTHQGSGTTYMLGQVPQQVEDSQLENLRRQTNQIALNALLYCDEQLSDSSDEEGSVQNPVNREVSDQELKVLEEGAKHYDHLRNMINSLNDLISKVDEKIMSTDFSNGYEEDKRNEAKFKEVGGLFNTFNTVQNFFDQRYEYLEADRKSPQMKEAFKTWYDAAMGNLATRILREVAKNNQDSRRGELAPYQSFSREYLLNNEDVNNSRNYILGRIGALDEESNPIDWRKAALFDLEKFFAGSNQRQEALTPDQYRVLRTSFDILKRYA